jgi:hypothetical protein
MRVRLRLAVPRQDQVPVVEPRVNAAFQVAGYTLHYGLVLSIHGPPPCRSRAVRARPPLRTEAWQARCTSRTTNRQLELNGKHRVSVALIRIAYLFVPRMVPLVIPFECVKRGETCRQNVAESARDKPCYFPAPHCRAALRSRASAHQTGVCSSVCRLR